MIKKLEISEIENNFEANKSNKNYFFPSKGKQPEILNPYRISTYAIGLYHSGRIELKANLKKNIIEAQNLIVIPPSVIREWYFYNSPPINSALFFSKEFILSELSNTNLFNELAFLKSNKAEIYKLDTNQIKQFEGIFSDLFSQSNAKSPNQAKIISLKLATLLYQIDEINKNIETSNDTPSSRQQFLANQFIDLVSLHFVSERNVNFYADQLNVTSKYLSQIVSDKTGQNASELIRERVLLEAKVLLRNQEKNISEISYALKFSSPTQFGKYFKKYCKISPGVYRKQLMTLKKS